MLIAYPFLLKRIRLTDAAQQSRVTGFNREDSGAAAVEFALVALPFLFLILSIFELALVFLISTTLQNALITASRTIRTGALQSGSTPTAAAFVSTVCADMGWLQATCTGQLQVDVRPQTSFANPTEPDPMATKTFNPAVLTFNPGSAGQIVLVRGFYQWPLLAPGFDAALSKGNNGVDVIVATTTFVNEPYT